jgi:hypothetical protein
LNRAIPQKRHRQNARDHNADYLPRIAEGQAHFCDSLGFDQHKTSTKEEKREVSEFRPFR